MTANSLKTLAKDPTDAIFGMGTDGKVVHMTISSMPHILVAGTTGSGKSVFINQLLVTMMAHATPDELKIALVDPKKVEFTRYTNTPYMLVNPITDMDNASSFVLYLTIEMDRRYDLMAKVGARNLESYNDWAEKNNQEKLPYIVGVIDEFSDLIGLHRDVEAPVIRIGQKGRASGIHLIVATQSPRADVITGLIKANFPSRVSLKVASSLESSIILDEMGGEKLKNHGDMLIKTVTSSKKIRAQGAFISDKELDAILDDCKERYGEPELVDYQQIVNGAAGNEDEQAQGSVFKKSNVTGENKSMENDLKKKEAEVKEKREAREARIAANKKAREERMAKRSEALGANMAESLTEYESDLKAPSEPVTNKEAKINSSSKSDLLSLLKNGRD